MNHKGQKPVLSYARRVGRAVMNVQEPPGRGITVRSDDVFLTSYPKSGNTWIRFLVANLVWSELDTSFTNLDSRVPDIYTTSATKLQRLPSPRMLKSHECFDPRYPKVLYVVRDVRSVLVSYHHYLRRKGRLSKDYGYCAFAEDFVNGRIDGYGSWRDNVTSWLSLRGHEPDRFLLVRYEDLVADGLRELARIADFLGIEASNGKLERAIEGSSFERMRALEAKAGHAWVENRRVRSGSFVRAGLTDEWRTALPDDVIDFVVERSADVMHTLGYL